MLHSLWSTARVIILEGFCETSAIARKFLTQAPHFKPNVRQITDNLLLLKRPGKSTQRWLQLLAMPAAHSDFYVFFDNCYAKNKRTNKQRNYVTCSCLFPFRHWWPYPTGPHKAENSRNPFLLIRKQSTRTRHFQWTICNFWGLPMRILEWRRTKQLTNSHCINYN